jgi:hypothetical protein
VGYNSLRSPYLSIRFTINNQSNFYLNLMRLVFPIMLEAYFTLADYNERSEQDIRNDRESSRYLDIKQFHRMTHKYGIPFRRICLQELISTIDKMIDPKDKTCLSSPTKYFRKVAQIPSFYKTLLRHPRNSDYPHWIINKLRRMGGDNASINYSNHKLQQLSFRALVY